MEHSFARCFKTLGRDNGRTSRFGICSILIILAIWGAWSALASVRIHAVSSEARLEAVSAAQPISVPLTGRIVESHLVLGRVVAAGDLLAVLDHETQTLELSELEAATTALSARLEVARMEVSAYEQSLSDGLEAARAAVDEASAMQAAAAIEARFSREIADFYSNLNKAGHAAPIEKIRTTADAAQSGAKADATGLAVRRLEWDWQRQNSETRADLEHARAIIAELEGAIRTNAAAVNRVRHEIERRHIRAYMEGQIGQIGDVKIGTIVNAGDHLGDIVPDEQLHIVARFAPADALGRIRPGQSAKMRLHGFPWTQYGTAEAKVASVSSELCDGAIRVELELLSLPDVPFSRTHGLPGTVEIEVERVSPAKLVLRSTGYFLSDIESNATLATINPG